MRQAAKEHRVEELEQAAAKALAEREDAVKQSMQANEQAVAARAELEAANRKCEGMQATMEKLGRQLGEAVAERDAMMVSLSASLRVREEAAAAHEKEKQEAAKNSKEREEALNAMIVQLTNLNKVLEGDVARVGSMSGENEGLKATIASLQQCLQDQTNLLPPASAGSLSERAQFASIERLERLQDENQLLQRISGMQELVSLLSTKHSDDMYFEGDLGGTIQLSESMHHPGGYMLNSSMQSDSSLIVRDYDANRPWASADLNLSSTTVKLNDKSHIFNATVSHFASSSPSHPPPSPHGPGSEP